MNHRALFAIALAGVFACATTPKGRAQQSAVIQKLAVDGVGEAYLDYCKIVRRPICIEEDKDAADAGAPQTRDQRIACLKPCDSATAEKIQQQVDNVRTAQTVLFELLRRTETSDAELAASRAQLKRAAAQLTLLLEQLGIADLLGDAVEGS